MELANGTTTGLPEFGLLHNFWIRRSHSFRLPQGGADWILATKNDIEQHFSAHGAGKITEIKLMNGFGFIEYEDAMDARDVVPGMLLPA